ncbi:MAG: hypothetical protein ACRED5_08165 [Propylenella sp.]
MSDAFHSPTPLSPLAAAFGLGVALVALFAICAIVQAFAPGLNATHAWIGLFTAAEPGSVRAWVEGLFYSALFGAFAGAVFVAGYNAVLRRSA